MHQVITASAVDELALLVAAGLIAIAAISYLIGRMSNGGRRGGPRGRS